MRSSGIVIIYNDETYEGQLVNYTTSSQPADVTGHTDSQSQSDSFNLMLLIILVCVLVPLVLAAFILTLVVVIKVRRFRLLLTVVLNTLQSAFVKLRATFRRTVSVIIIATSTYCTCSPCLAG